MTMTIKPLEQASEEASLAVSKQRKAAPWSYYFYCEILKMYRDPWTVMFGIGFPTLFFLIFGSSVYAKYASTLLAQYAAYGVFVASFQTFSISIAVERNKGWNKLLRTTSMSPVLYLGSKFLVVTCTCIFSMLILCTVAVLTGKVHMALSSWLLLFGMMVLGMIPFALAGIFLGFVGTFNLSQVISTVVTLLFSFTSGLFVPLQFMPDFVRTIAPYLPTYHLAQLAWFAVGSTLSRDSHPLWLHLLVLGVFTVIFALLAWWAYLQDENENYA